MDWLSDNLESGLLILGGAFASCVWWSVTTGRKSYFVFFLGLTLFSVFFSVFVGGATETSSSADVSRIRRYLADGLLIASGVAVFNGLAYLPLDSALMYKNAAMFFGSMGLGLHLGGYLDRYPGRTMLLFLFAVAAIFFWSRGSGAFDRGLDLLYRGNSKISGTPH